MEYLPRCTAKQLTNALRKVIFLHARGGFVVRHAMMDIEFEKMKDLFPLVEVNTASMGTHGADRASNTTPERENQGHDL